MSDRNTPVQLPQWPELMHYEYSSSDASKTLPVHNPATGELITTLRVGDASTVAQAVAKGEHAFRAWAPLPPARRAALMTECANVLDAHAAELATMLCLENGKPFLDALSGDLRVLVWSFNFFGNLAATAPTEFHARGPLNAVTVREPYGVVAGILPFNWPPIHAGGKMAPALAAGNSVILKPGEQAPLTVMRIVELLQSVLPEGLVQAVPGNGPEVPQALIEHPKVRFVSFTGSTFAGRKVSETAAKSLTKVALELGGKNAFVVFEDADLDLAARYALEGNLFNKGEACTSASRVLVHSSVHDAFIEKLAPAWRKVRTGDGMLKDTHVGPQVSEAQQKRILDYLESAKNEGAKVEAQAPVPTDTRLKNGYWVPPTLLSGVTRTMRVAQEEIFGPVLTICKFENEDEAVDIANESPYGLCAIAFTRDMARGARVSRRLEAGMVWINNYVRNTSGLPFGGFKDSGNHREHCAATLAEYSQTKVVQTPSGMGALPNWRTVQEVFDGQKGAVGGAFG